MEVHDLALLALASVALVTAIRALFASSALVLSKLIAFARWMFKPSAVTLALTLATVAYFMKSPASAMWQYIATRFIAPVYIQTHLTPSAASALRAELREKVDAYTYEQVMRWTDSTARAIGCTTDAILMVALLECGLNPFRIRDDKVAAGWLQFTRAGLNAHGVSLERVIRACNEKDVNFIMSLSHRYLVRKAQMSHVPTNTAIDVYLAVFAPSKIGSDAKSVIYAGKSNPAYYMNEGLDGWKLSNSGVIYRSIKDGSITVEELYLCMMHRVSLNEKKWRTRGVTVRWES